jgi:hypothetical protein
MVAVGVASASTVATRSLAGDGGQEVERELDFTLDAEGFAVEVSVTNNDGDVTATAIIDRGPQVAYYTTPAEVTADRVIARFGAFGELDYRFTPKRNGRIECVGAEDGEAVFEGTFDFTGENGYVHIEADRAEGTFQVYPEPKGCSQRRLGWHTLRYQPVYSGPGATLHARAVSRPERVTREVSVYDGGGKKPHPVFVFAILGERHEGVSIGRGLQLAAGSGAFDWNVKRGSATLRPPAPFAGWATFRRKGQGGHRTWKGSLTMPIFGGEPVKLAGHGFHAALHKGVPQDE